MPPLLFLIIFSLSFASCQSSESQKMSSNDVWKMNQAVHRSTDIMDKVIQENIIEATVKNSYSTYSKEVIKKAKTIKKATQLVYDSLLLFQQQIAFIPLETANSKSTLLRFLSLKKSALKLQEQSLDFFYKSWDSGGIKGTIFADSTRRPQHMQFIKEKLNPIHIDQENKGLPISNNNLLQTSLGVLQQKVKQNETIFTYFFTAQLGKIWICGSPWTIASNSSKSCIRLGETYETDITFLEVMPHHNYELRVDTHLLKTIDNRSKSYPILAQFKGEQCFWTSLVVTNPLNKEKIYVHKPFYFEVSP